MIYFLFFRVTQPFYQNYFKKCKIYVKKTKDSNIKWKLTFINR
jgi:hypothetical protein